MNRSFVAGALALAALLAAPLGARAQLCNTLPHPVYVTGSTAIKALLPKIGAALHAGTGADQITLVYSAPGGGPFSGSCKGVNGLVDATMTGQFPSGATGTYWTDATMTAGTSCTIPDGTRPDMAFSDVFGETCRTSSGGAVDLSHVMQSSVVVLPFMFIVPEASTEFYIDTRDAYLVYGKGPAAAMASPWSAAATSVATGSLGGVYARNSGSGTQITIGLHIHVPAGGFLAFDAGSGGTMVTSVGGGTPADGTLGFASADGVDPARAMLNVLAYRHWEQDQFWYPDSDDTTYDKRPVRDGHYPLWSYEHAMIRTTSGTTPESADAAHLVDFLTGVAALPGTADLNDIFSKASLPPICSMAISRPTDGADFAVYADADPCGCFFEEHVTGATAGISGCTACTSDAMCTGGTHCHHGYCE
jgi:hypothetical protein